MFAFFTRLKNDSLSRNAFFLMASTFTMAGLGFFFWAICAKLFTPEQIGLATTLISLTSLVTSFSMLGFNASILRYLPQSKHKNELINTSFAIVSLASVVVTGLLLVGLPWFSPKLTFIQQYPLFEVSLLVFMIVASLNAITDSVFIAYRRAEFIFIINTCMSLVKLALPVLLVGLGTYGIFYSFLSSINVAMVLSVLFLTIFLGYEFTPKIDKDSFRRLWKFSAANYLAGVIGMLNTNITPVLITNTLGPEITAYYFMPSMIISLVQAITRSIAASMTAEGSAADLHLKPLFIKSLKLSLFLMLPIVGVLMFVGPYILSVFGKSYTAEGTVFLRFVLVSLVLSIPNTFFGAVLTLRKRVKAILVMSIVGAFVGLSLTYLFLPAGLYGLGLANIIGAVIMVAIYTVLFITKLI